MVGQIVNVRQTATGQRGAVGEAAAEYQFTKLGWGVLGAQRHDLGTDLMLLARDHRLNDLGQPVGAQVKAGESWFEEPVRDESGEVIGWWFRDDDRAHLDYWAQYAVPHLLVLHDENTEISYWVHVQAELIVPAGKSAKIMVSRANQVGGDQLDALLKVAVSKRPAPAWEGSVWANADDIPPDDRMRYALLAPRLVAPHRNAGVRRPISGVEGIALLVEGRGNEIERFAETYPEVPTLDQAPESPDWTWRFAGAIAARLRTGEVDHLPAFVEDAPTAASRSAAVVVAAAGLLELARPDVAIELLGAELARDESSPVDHAWLSAQLARAQHEIGNLDEARTAAAEAFKVRLGKNGDVTASAVAGVGAVELFSMSDWGAGDTQAAVTGMDNAAAWWRTERVASGSNAVVERQFLAWTRRSAIVIDFEDVPNNRLLTAGLLASHLGDQGTWRNINALNAKQAFLKVTRSSEAHIVSGLLAELRTAGDHKALDHAVRRLLNDGPAAAVRAAAAEIDLGSLTRTTSKASLVLLRRGGDVLDEDLAGRVVDWILATGSDATGFVRRTTPTFDVLSEFVQTLTGVLHAAPQDKQVAVAEFVLQLPAQEHELMARAWSEVVRALPSSIWTPDRAVRGEAVASQHNDWLRVSLLAVAALSNETAASRLVQEVEGGSLLALNLLSFLENPGLLVTEIADRIMANLESRVDSMIANARLHQHSTNILDFGRTLAVMNVEYPEIARWEIIYALLGEPLVAAEHKRGVCIALSRIADKLSGSVRERLAGLALEVATGPESPYDLAFRSGMSAAGPAALVVAKLLDDVQTTSALLVRLLGGDVDQRAWAAWVASHLPEEAAGGVLATLTNDDSSTVRAAAAANLTQMVGAGLRSPLADEALERAVEDPGTLVAQSVMSAREVPENAVEALENHLSARVRRAVAERRSQLYADHQPR